MYLQYVLRLMKLSGQGKLRKVQQLNNIVRSHSLKDLILENPHRRFCVIIGVVTPKWVTRDDSTQPMLDSYCGVSQHVLGSLDRGEQLHYPGALHMLPQEHLQTLRISSF